MATIEATSFESFMALKADNEEIFVAEIKMNDSFAALFTTLDNKNRRVSLLIQDKDSWSNVINVIESSGYALRKGAIINP